ncbi:MAG: FeoB-associated Cys-rich membrane protein [Deltaproteobacteria bacterium]|nr:FeoB-associated Cys-rich membrane protein [Deltaproteobacteria bacterium]
MELFIIAVIVGLAAFFVARRFYHMFKNTKTEVCGCGCTSCPVQEATCEINDLAEKPFNVEKP